MHAILGPASGGGADFRVFHITIGAVGQEKFNHRAMTVECGVVQARAIAGWNFLSMGRDYTDHTDSKEKAEDRRQRAGRIGPMSYLSVLSV